MIYLSILNGMPDGSIVNLMPNNIDLRVDNYHQGTVTHRRDVHRRLHGGYYVVADPKHWFGSFTFTCEDVTFRQISFLRTALTATLTTGEAFLEAGTLKLAGHYVPETLIVVGVQSMADRRKQRNVSFSFEGKITL